MTTTEPNRPHTLSQTMGLIVALRFLAGGLVVFLLSVLFSVTLAGGQIKAVSLGLMFSFYMFAVGNVLLLMRLKDGWQRLLLLLPVAAVALLSQDVVGKAMLPSLVLCALACAGYLEALRREMMRLEESQAGRVTWRLLFLFPSALLLCAVLPELGVPVVLASTLGVLYALRLWLQELRSYISQLDTE